MVLVYESKGRTNGDDISIILDKILYFSGIKERMPLLNEGHTNIKTYCFEITLINEKTFEFHYPTKIDVQRELRNLKELLEKN